MKTTVKIGEQEVSLECNAYTPVAYRLNTGGDLLTDLSHISEDNPDTVIMLNLVFVMAKQAGFDGTMENFLSQFELLDVYAVLPTALAFWTEQASTTSKPKKDHVK